MIRTEWLCSLSTAAALIVVVVSASFGPESDAQERFLEIVIAQEMQSPAIHLALLDRDIATLSSEVEEQRLLVASAQEQLDEAERHERRNRSAQLVREQQSLQRLEGRLARLLRDGLSERQRSLFVLHCWDGFAKVPVTLWYFQNDSAVRRFRSGDILRALTNEDTLRFLRVDPAMWCSVAPPLQLPDTTRRPPSTGNAVEVTGETLASFQLVRSTPQGFLRFRFVTEAMPWEAHPVSDVQEIAVSVLESPDANDTMLLLVFKPSRSQSPDLAQLRFRIHALDQAGEPKVELTGPDGITEIGLFQNPICTYFDPGRRFAHGFRVTVERATFRGRKAPSR